MKLKTKDRKMEKNEVILQENPNLSLIDTLEMQKGTEVIFKARGRHRVPQKILRVHQNFCLIQHPHLNPIHLTDGDYVAAYKTPLTKTVSGAYYIAPLTKNELKVIDDILKKHFNTSLEAEKKANHPSLLKTLPMLAINQNTYARIDENSTTHYNSDGCSSIGLSHIISLNRDMQFAVVNPDEKYTYHANKDDYFAVILKKTKNNSKFYVVPFSKDDFPTIKMQDKKEMIARKYQLNKFLRFKSVFHSNTRA